MKELIAELKSKAIFLSVDKEELVIDYDGEALTHDLILRIKNNKSALINYLNKYNNHREHTKIPILPVNNHYPISDAQKRLWILSQFEEGSVAYNLPGKAYLNLEIEIENFKRAVDATIDRHEILRTVFREDDEGEIRQWILKREALGFVIDYQDFRNEPDKEGKTGAYIAADANQPFDLAKGPLLRAALLHIEEEEYVFYYNLHHIISDGWSTGVLSKDVFSYYEAYQSGTTPEIQELRIQYKDYSSWQLAQLNEDAFKAHKAYWLDKLSGELPLLDLPTIQQRPKFRSYNGHSLTTYLDKDTTARLKGYVQEHGGSLFMGILASWNVLMYRYTAQEDIIIGTPVAGRDHADLEDQIGFYVNTLVLRNKVNGESSFDSFYQDLKEETFKSYSHQMYPFDRLVEDLDLQRDTSRSAVFDIMLILQNTVEMTEGVEPTKEELTQIVDQGAGTSKFDLEVTVQELGGYLSMRFVYNTDVYEQVMVEGLIRHYKQLLGALLGTPEEKISQIDYLSDEEKHKLLVTNNDTTVAYPKDKTIVDLFEAQVTDTPDQVAVVFEDTELTYQELDARSNQLAHYLRDQYDIQPDDLVGIKQERSEWMLISILGVLKSGGAYVPIDPEYPQERIDYIERDTNCKVCLDESELNKFSESEAAYPDEPIRTATTSSHLLYVIYTSGSTGQPKGVMVEHQSLVNRLLWMKRELKVEESDVFLQKTPVTFDVSVWELFLPLLSGSKLVFARADGHKDPQYLDELIARQQVSIIHFVPSMLSAALDTIQWEKLEHLRHVVCSGEALSKSIESSFREKAPLTSLHNYYGPTEASIDVTAIDLSQHPTLGSEVAIGKPVDNTSIYITDDKNGLQPIGVIGELLIGGDQVARGYLNREELTREKFVASPFKEGERLYKTGDLGRWLPDGNIEFIGRQDDQVKIRGFRIELGEIAHALEQNKEVKQAVVLARENASGEKELVAYLTADIEQQVDELRSYLKDSLPEYMLPAYFVQLETMPLTSNGKVDKKSLPAPEGLGLTSGVEYVAPRNEIEEQLVKMWEEVLQRENIGVNDDFFAMGGHSLKAVRLSNEYQKELAVKLTLKDLFAHTSIASHTALIASSTRKAFVQIEQTTIQESYPISDAQRRLWVLSQFEGGSSAYNMPGSLKLNQAIEIENFQRAIDATIDRHEILRTVFREDESGEARQWILEREELGFVIDYQDFKQAPNKRERIEEYIAAETFRQFDLERGPLLRAALLQLSEDEYVFYYNMHHIISDGWSLEVLSKDVFSCYEAYQSGTTPEIQELRIQYRDYSSWQLAQLNEDAFKAHKAYWLDKLSGELPLLDLPTIQQRPKFRSYNGHSLTTYLDKDTTARLKGYVQEHGGSLFMGILASWNILMYRYTAQEDIIMGTPVAGRDHADLEDQIGFYVNTLVLRNEVKGESSFDSFYQDLKEETFKSYNHQMYPFDRLVEDLDLQRDTSRSAVFDVMLILENGEEMTKGIELSEEELTQIVDRGASTSKFDLEVTVKEIGGYLSMRFVYNTDVYEQVMVEGLIRHYKQLLGALLYTPEEKISQIDYLSEEEKHQLLVTNNDNAVVYPKDKTIVDLFEAQVTDTPDQVAVVFEDTELTYRDLDARANQLAHYLRDQYDIQPDDLVGIKQERSEWMLISILGALKSGGAYVPIDPEYPQERIDYIERDTNCKVCLDESELNKFRESEAAYPDKPIRSATTSSHLLYVIYTSGSTGQPKGVMVEHRSLVNRLLWMKRELMVEESDVFLQKTPVTFDVSVWELFLPLLSGSKLVFARAEAHKDPQYLDELIARQKVSIIHFVPSMLSAALDTIHWERLERLRHVVCSGEALPKSIESSFREKAPLTSLHNYYGPTEASIDVTAIDLSQHPTLGSEVAIGKPVDNTSIYITDEKNGLQPIGVIGELLIGGDQVARGYLNREELTKDKFITSPFKDGERLYKTGDLARWLPDGNIEFIGRKDDQVKIRGHRIELGEIAHALAQNKEVKQALVLARKNASGEKELVAYLTSDTNQEINELRSYLKERLPEYMLPAYFVQLETMPLTSNGKVDKKSLPAPEGLGLTSGVEYVAPRNETEEQLVKMWEEVLQRENIGVNDDFFALGGHSLKAVRLSNEYQKELAVKLTLKDLFAHTSIASQAVLIASSTRKAFVQIEQTTIQESYPISDAQRRLWVLSQFEGGSSAYNMPGSLKLNQAIEVENFQRAIDATIDRHEVLRTVFREDESGEVRQWILEREELGFVIDYQDFSKAPNKRERTERYIAAESYQPFDLEQGPLLRAALIQLSEDEYVFYYNMHHIISDGWSLEVLSKDVFSYYEAYQSGTTPEIQKLRIQYKDYASWQLAQLNEDSFQAHKAYWLDKLSGELPLLDLPTIQQRPKFRSYNGHSLTIYLDKDTTARLKGYVQEHGGSLFMGILASWNVLMYRYTAQEDIIIGTPVAGRDHADLEDQIGFYVNTLVLRNEVNGESSFDSFYQDLKEETFKSYSHQMYPFDRLVEDLDLQRDTSRSAVFDIMLILQNTVEMTEGVEPTKEELTQIVDQGASTSKFDLEFTVQEIGGYLSLKFVYNTDVYEREMVEGLIRHYKQLLKALLTTPGEKISQIDYLSNEEKHELLVTNNDTTVAYPKDKTIIDLFEAQVTKTPDSIAVVFEDTKLTYRELDASSNQLAHYLRDQYDIRPDDLVGIKQERSEWMLISILGVLKSGGAYVPIDTEYPQERIQAIAEDSKYKALLDTNELLRYRERQGEYSTDQATISTRPDNLAYVIYTSGSTGKPKGVMIEHRNVTNFFTGMTSIFGEEKGTFLSMTNFTFDISVLELLWTLVKGYKVIIQGDATQIDEDQDAYSVYSQVRRHRVTHLQMTPSMGTLLNQHLSEEEGWGSLKKVLLGGEPATTSLLNDIYEKLPNAQLYNMYGPTETTIWSTVKALDKNTERIEVGAPIANTRIYILDKHQNPVTKGVQGELYIGGEGVARGYTSKQLTDLNFIESPFVPGDRIYRTGDYGSWLSNGSIYCSGRKDQQVKIRGYRIELGEIAYALERHEEINQSVVVTKENESGDKELIAYVTAKSQQNISELRSYLSETLPVYMLPGYFVQLEELPLTASGKIDRKSLPPPEGLGLTSGVEYVAPRNEIEEQLAKIWEEVLDRENIGVNDDFFALGGHSLKAVRLSNEYQKELSVKLTLKDLFAHTSIASHATLIASSTSEAFVQIERATPQASYALSDGQRRLWVLSQFEGGSTAYNMPGSLNLSGKYELALFEKSFDSLINRHEILRTVFREDESGEVRQWILEKENLGFEIDYHDFRAASNKRERTEEYIATDSYQPFDLEQGPLLRAALLQLSEDEYVFYFNMHHIISDGWSIEVLSKDVFSYYEAYQSGTTPEIQKLRIQYKDYSSWQLAQLNEDSFQTHKAYWLDKLSGELPLLDLPTIQQRPKFRSYNGHSLTTYLDKDTTARLKGYVQEHGGSLFMGILASWNVLMYRYTAQEDIIMGTPVAGRDHADLEDQIGFYVNTLALRNEVKGESSFDSFYQDLKEETFKSYNHQMYPFDRLVEDLDLQRDTSRSAVFDVMLILENGEEMTKGIELSEKELTQIVDQGAGTSKFDLEFTVQEIGGYLSMRFVYNTDVYEREMVEGLIRHYKQLLQALLGTPEEKISQIDYLSDEEKHQLLVTNNDNAVVYPKDKTIVDLFEAQVAKTPDQVAVVFEDTELTYRELDARSNQLAHYLRDQYDIQPDDLVGIKQERSEWMLISILGVLKSGGAYVPIDPEYPQERIDYIERDTNCKVCLDESELNKFRESEAAYPDEPIRSSTTSSHLLYVIYTSGSTGQPKGVMVEHRSLVNRLLWMKRELMVEESDVFLQKTPVTFDVSVWELFLPLLSGSKLVFARADGHKDPQYLDELIARQKVSIIHFVPSMLSAALDTIQWKKLEHLRHVVCSGEALSKSIESSFREKAPLTSLHNYYGPTEASIDVTAIDLSQHPTLGSEVAIGKPVDNTSIYITDDKNGLQPIGVIGELLIGGDQVARGYLNREELTREKFVASPFKEGERLYKTGDLARWLPDGNIEFIGRKDDQVKIRGHRIELGEIAHALAQNKEVKQAVVLARENASDEKELVAYLTSDTDQEINELRSYLKDSLPEYMLPAYFVQLETMPLTSNGKVDKKSLPDPEGLGLTSSVEYVAPRNEIEEQLVKMWEEVLQRENIGVKDDFFALGGHSLKALTIVFRVNEEFKIGMKITDLFNTSTIEELAISVAFALNRKNSMEKLKEIEL